MRAEQPDSGPNPGKRRGRIGRAHSYSGSQRCAPEHGAWACSQGVGKAKRAHILVVARIANDGASRIIRIFRLCRISGLAARKIARVRIADRTRKRSAKDELFVRAVEKR